MTVESRTCEWKMFDLGLSEEESNYLANISDVFNDEKLNGDSQTKLNIFEKVLLENAFDCQNAIEKYQADIAETEKKIEELRKEGMKQLRHLDFCQGRLKENCNSILSLKWFLEGKERPKEKDVQNLNSMIL